MLALILLYLLLSVFLQAIYGPSFGFLSGEDAWVPAGSGGWVRHGAPSGPPPDQPSIDVPITVRYIPILVPGLILLLFLFTPLSRLLESAGRTGRSESSATEPETK